MKLFYDDEFDAITACIGSSGKQFKDVAQFMFPDMKPESAYAKLKVCCTPTGDQRLTFGQVIRLMLFCENFDPLLYACDETLHARPPRTAPADQEVKLVEALTGAAEVMNKAMRQLDSMRTRGLIKSAS